MPHSNSEESPAFRREESSMNTADALASLAEVG